MSTKTRNISLVAVLGIAAVILYYWHTTRITYEDKTKILKEMGLNSLAENGDNRPIILRKGFKNSVLNALENDDNRNAIHILDLSDRDLKSKYYIYLHKKNMREILNHIVDESKAINNPLVCYVAFKCKRGGAFERLIEKKKVLGASIEGYTKDVILCQVLNNQQEYHFESKDPTILSYRFKHDIKYDEGYEISLKNNPYWKVKDFEDIGHAIHIERTIDIASVKNLDGTNYAANKYANNNQQVSKNIVYISVNMEPDGNTTSLSKSCIKYMNETIRAQIDEKTKEIDHNRWGA